jgi:hypothetical protein
MLLTLVVRLPRPDDHTRIGLAARGKHTTLDIRALPLPSDAIDFPSGTVDVTMHERRR